MAEPLDVARRAILELAAIVLSEVHMTPGGRSRIERLYRDLDALHHSAEDDGEGRCKTCGAKVATSVVHIWPLS